MKIAMALGLIMGLSTVFVMGRCVKTVHFDTMDQTIGAKGSYCAERQFFTWEQTK